MSVFLFAALGSAQLIGETVQFCSLRIARDAVTVTCTCTPLLDGNKSDATSGQLAKIYMQLSSVPFNVEQSYECVNELISNN